MFYNLYCKVNLFQERQNGLALMAVHKDILINANKVPDKLLKKTTKLRC